MTKNNANTNNITTTTAEFVIGFVKSIQNKIHGCEDCPHRNFWDCLVMHKECKCFDIKTWYESNEQRIPLPEFIVSAEEADKLDPISDRIEDDLGQEIVQDLKDDQILDFEDLEIKRKEGIYDVKIYFYLDELGNKIFYYRATKHK